MRLIDADALPVVHAYVDDDGMYRDIVYNEDLNAAPTVDAVAVVRCIDCKNSNKIAGNETMRHCWNHRGNSKGCGFSVVAADGYCDEGERKEPADDL